MRLNTLVTDSISPLRTELQCLSLSLEICSESVFCQNKQDEMPTQQLSNLCNTYTKYTWINQIKMNFNRCQDTYYLVQTIDICIYAFGSELLLLQKLCSIHNLYSTISRAPIRANINQCLDISVLEWYLFNLKLVLFSVQKCF